MPKKLKIEKKYKAPSAVIRAARKLLGDPANWTIGSFNQCLNIPEPNHWQDTELYEREIAAYLENNAPLLTPEEAREHNEECMYCILGAVGHFDVAFNEHLADTNEGGVIELASGRYVEQAARELYGRKGELKTFKENFSVAEEFSVAVAVNDENRHRTARGAYKAVLRILDRALELSEGKAV